MTLLWHNLWIFSQSVIRLTKNHCRFSYLGAIFHCLLAASVALFRGRQTLIGSANCTPNNKLFPSPPLFLHHLWTNWGDGDDGATPSSKKFPSGTSIKDPSVKTGLLWSPSPLKASKKELWVWWITRFDPIVGNRKFLTICPLWLLAQEMALHVIWCPIFAPYDIPNIDYICKYGPKTSWRQVHQT